MLAVYRAYHSRTSTVGAAPIPDGLPAFPRPVRVRYLAGHLGMVATHNVGDSISWRELLAGQSTTIAINSLQCEAR